MAIVALISPNSIGQLHAAARIRFEEAETLYEAELRLGAVYLYGYAIKMIFAARIVRTRFDRGDDIEITVEERDTIVLQANGRSKMGKGRQLAHPVDGLASLLISERKEACSRLGGKRSQADLDIDSQLEDHGDTVLENWRPTLRYQAFCPTQQDADKVRKSAEWCLSHYDEL